MNKEPQILEKARSAGAKAKDLFLSEIELDRCFKLTESVVSELNSGKIVTLGTPTLTAEQKKKIFMGFCEMQLEIRALKKLFNLVQGLLAKETLGKETASKLREIFTAARVK